ncbi:pro-MCH [Hippocampus zosterae]|uniref:pro-MCH n=1 Tax=Hippocampus zosterae TaxID=109293 RepID=UPI00223E1AD2|nr:pro-MCH [Hippocampus zosterae]
MSRVRHAVLALLLLSNLSGRSLAGAADNDGLSAPVWDDGDAAALRTNWMWDVADEDAKPKVLPLAGTRRRGSAFPAFHRRLPASDEARWRENPIAEKIERRDADIDMLRCMIGRVYRPCWGGT